MGLGLHKIGVGGSFCGEQGLTQTEEQEKEGGQHDAAVLLHQWVLNPADGTKKADVREGGG